jgi:hypothetical protein
MLRVIVLYISLFIVNDTIKSVDHYTIPSTIAISDSLKNKGSDTANYLKTDSVIRSVFPSLEKVKNVFPPANDSRIMAIRQDKTQPLIAILLLLSLLTVAFVRAGYPKEFSELFSVLRSMSLTQQIYRVQTNSLNMPLAILTINAVLSFSLSVYFILQFRGIHLHYSGASLFLIISSIVSLLFIYRLGSGLFTGMLFPVKKEMSFYSFCTLQVLRISGIALLPLNILFAFGNTAWQQWVVISLIVAVLVSIGFVYVRGYMITKELFRDNKFHFLLYICTLEIAPAVTIIKFLMTYIKKN